MSDTVNFIGIGAQKSGTSWVYACLYEHPQVCAPIKEIHFFSRPRFVQGKVWYENHFKKCDVTKIKGEFSTSYLYSKEAPGRIQSMYPNVHIIAILRNPVERAFSQYRNAIKAGEITQAVSFETFLANNESVIGQGRYYEQLVRYIELFPKERILVLIYEDIKKDPKAFMRRVYQFLGVDDTFESSMLYTEINVARTPKAVVIDRCMHHISETLRRFGFDRLVHAIRKIGLPDLVRSYNTKKEARTQEKVTSLDHYFYDDVRQLSTLLDRDLVTQWGIKKI
jgi:hypothetical protein